MVYGPIDHVWDWKLNRPARRLTGAEVAVIVFGRGGADDWAFGSFVEQDREMLHPTPTPLSKEPR